MGKVISIEERRKARRYEGTEELTPEGSEPPDGWSGTWTRQEPYSNDSKRLYHPLSEEALKAFPQELSDILNFKWKGGD